MHNRSFFQSTVTGKRIILKSSIQKPWKCPQHTVVLCCAGLSSLSIVFWDQKHLSCTLSGFSWESVLHQVCLNNWFNTPKNTYSTSGNQTSLSLHPLQQSLGSSYRLGQGLCCTLAGSYWPPASPAVPRELLPFGARPLLYSGWFLLASSLSSSP